MVRLLLVLSLVGIAALPILGQAPPARATAVFDVASIVRGHTTVPLRVCAPVAVANSMADTWVEYRVGNGELIQLMDTDRLVDLIRMGIGGESWDSENVSLRAEGSRIILTQSPAVIAEVGQWLSYVQKVVDRNLRLEIYTATADKVVSLAAGGLSPAEVQTWLGTESPRLVARLMLVPGIASRCRSGDELSYVADYDVEVAQQAQIADPVIRVLENGLDLRVQADPLPAGDFVLRTAFVRASLDSFREFKQNGVFVGTSQLPVVDSTIVHAQARVASGGAVILGVAQGAGDDLLVARLLADALPDAPQTGVCITPFGGIAAPRARNRSLRTAGLLPSHLGENDDGAEEGEGEPVFDLHSLMELMRMEAGAEGVFEGDSGTFANTDGRNLYTKAPADVRKSLIGSAERLFREASPKAGLEFRIGRLAASDSRGLLDGSSDLAAVAGSLTTRAYVSALGGGEFSFADGREVAYLKDHDVEIAQDAVIADPQPAVVFFGTAVKGSVSRGPGSTWSLAGELTVRSPVGDVVVFDGSANDVGAVEEPRAATQRARLTATLTAGAWSLLHLATEPAGKDMLVVLVRLRE